MGYYKRKNPHKKKQPNGLCLVVDQERFPTVYETKELQEQRKENLVAQELLREHGLGKLQPTKDPLEKTNLADPTFATIESAIIQRVLTKVLEEQCRQKRLTPTSGKVP